MESYKCEFCAYQVGPIKPIPPECTECRFGNHFQIKTKLHPIDIAAWGKTYEKNKEDSENDLYLGRSGASETN